VKKEKEENLDLVRVD